MKNRIPVLISIFLLIIVILSSNSLKPEATDAVIWEEKVTSDIHKTWTVYFNQPLRSETVSKSTVYVTTDKNKWIPVSISISDDEMSLTVIPEEAYTPGVKYWLFINQKVRSSSRDTLEKSVWMPFKVSTNSKSTESSSPNTNSEKELQLKVEIAHSQLLSTITVVSKNPEVTQIYLGQSRMQYEGNNTFTLARSKIEKGDKLLFKALDSSNKQIIREFHNVK